MSGKNFFFCVCMRARVCVFSLCMCLCVCIKLYTLRVVFVEILHAVTMTKSEAGESFCCLILSRLILWVIWENVCGLGECIVGVGFSWKYYVVLVSVTCGAGKAEEC